MILRAWRRWWGGGFLILTTVLFSGGVQAQVLDPAFARLDSRSENPNNPGLLVRTLATDPAGRLLVSGGFDVVNGQERGHLVRLLASGQPDASFDPGGTGANGPVAALVTLPNGQYLISGAFSYYDGHPVLAGLAKLQADGTFDPSFNLGGNGPSAPVSAMAVDGQGRILVAGSFESFNGQPRPGVARLLPTGALDPTFAPVVPSGRQEIWGLTTDAANNVLLGGFVTGTPQSTPLLTRLLPTGAADPTFVPDPTLMATAYYIQLVRVRPNGKVLVAGVAGGGGNPAVTLSQLNGNGSNDPGFVSPFGGTVADLVELPNQQLVVAGIMSLTGVTNFVRVARLQANGALDASFTAPAIGPWQQPLVIVAARSGGVVVGGSFDLPLRGLFRLTTTGALDAIFAAPTWQCYASISNLVVQSGDRLVALGDFGTIGGQPQPHVVRFTANGVLDPTFQLDPTIAASPQPLLVGSAWLARGLNERLFLVDRHRAYRLLPDGAPDPGFTLDVGAAGGFFQTLVGVHEQPDGRLLVWGNFTRYNQTRRVNLVRLLPNGSIDPSFVAPLDSLKPVWNVELMVDGTVLVYESGGLRWLDASGAPLASFNGGQPLAGAYIVGGLPDTTAIFVGEFTLNGITYGTSLTNNTFKVTPAGTVDTSFVIAPYPYGEFIRVVDGTIFAMGYNGPVGHLQRLLPTGAIDPAFAPVEIGDVLVFQSTGDLVVGGSFSTVDGVLRPTLARLTNIPNGLPTDLAAVGMRLDVFPNPAHTSFTLRRATAESATATLLDMMGRPVRRCLLTAAEQRLPLAGVPAGTYVVRVVEKDGVTTRRVVVE